MQYTAIALDYDGTIARNGVVPAHVLAGLRRLKSSGRRLLLVTGRELKELLGIFPGIGVFDRVVAENGALFFSPATGERRELGTPPPQALIDALRGSGIPLAVGHTILATIRPHENVVLECIANQGLEQQVIFNKGAVMVLPPGCNKASGLKYALAELRLSPRNLVAVGDGENDHALLEMAQYSVATANAVPMLKAAADFVTLASHGDGVLEIVAELIGTDLAALPPRRYRHAIPLGKDWLDTDVAIAGQDASLMIAGAAAATRMLAFELIDRICRIGYQMCVLDASGAYLDIDTLTAFGTPQSPPAFEEVLSALDKPELQAVVCLAALPPDRRIAFSAQLLARLDEMRSRTGRPHWILADETNSLVAGTEHFGGRMILVTDRPAALPPDVIATVDAIAACGAGAGSVIESFARVAGLGEPVSPGGPPKEGEALVWFPKGKQSVTLVDIDLRRPTPNRLGGPRAILDE